MIAEIQCLPTPAGTPATVRISMKAAAMTEVCSAGFMITALPATSGATVMPHRIASGKFHGAMTAQTPRGA